MKEVKIWCNYCGDRKGIHKRIVPIKNRNGYKLLDFEIMLCDWCNHLDDEFLERHYN